MSSPPPPAVPDVRFVDRGGGARLACVARPGASPTVVFLGGYASDMTGTKARYLEGWCGARGQAFLRFDYQGHGLSSGRLVDGTISAWRDDALAVLRECVRGPALLVGSSMGAWVMLLAARAAPERVHALVGVAAAPDFTEDLLWARLDDERRAALQQDGVIHLASSYGSPSPSRGAWWRTAGATSFSARPCPSPARSACSTAPGTTTCRGRPPCAWPEPSRAGTSR